MSFSVSLFDLAFFVAPAIKVALSSDEQSELAHLQSALDRRKSELVICKSNRAFAARVKPLTANIAMLETEIAELRIAARYRRGV